ncbi:MAG: PTS fructose-like transporter subunit IIB [Spirochaetes bacterium]|nr:PTS fructose-like transporter subunit IIB [Spirochaetota bacterium]
MAKIIAITACPTGIAHTIMAAEALDKKAKAMGHQIKVETQGSEGVKNALTDGDVKAADVLIIASDIQVDMSRFFGLPVVAASTSKAISKTQDLIEEALNEIDQFSKPESTSVADESNMKFVAITSCPTGIAHTFMAAEALRKSGEALGYQIKVETQGSVGAKNVLTELEIKEAYAVIIAADTNVDLGRFAGKRVYQTSTKAALHSGEDIIKAAINLPEPTGKSSLSSQVNDLKKERSAQRTGPYKHLMTGVSFMLPVVVAGGLIIALSFIFGIEAFKEEGTLAAALMNIGGGSAFALMVPVLAAYIAFSIADRPGITPGLVGGMLASSIGAGFLGGIVAGFLAGYLVKFMNEKIQLPDNLQGLKPILILPFLSTLIVGLGMIYLIGPPVKAALDFLTTWLSGMQDASAITLGLILGAMMAFDMGGPVNKAAYTFAVGLLGSNIYGPMAAVMAAVLLAELVV